ncbi:hypothetical protein BZA70DRAFT_275174 [Myxozyma melibiosi]|uniref:F-box domain-containing protein n=1 Tax=Myxozyma melibiosi TaxID=54550 RepID=A0ABR1FAH2_9ASCO
MERLPDEILLWIFELLDAPAFLQASHTCSRWLKLLRRDAVLAKHIRERICENPAELEYLEIVPHSCGREHKKSASWPKRKNNESWLEYLYLFFLRQKSIGLVLRPAYNLWLGEGLFDPMYYECSTRSDDGTLFIVVQRNKLTSPVPLRTVHIYNLHCVMYDRYTPPRPGTRRGNFELEDMHGPYLWQTLVLTESSDKKAQSVVVARDGKSIAIDFQHGYVEVYTLENLRENESHSQETWGRSSMYGPRMNLMLKRIYHQQFPSTVHSIALTSNAEVLVLGFNRLGGLTIVNLKTGETLDLPHYRLDLGINLQLGDQALMLTGFNETMVMRSFDPKDWEQKTSIWDYYARLIESTELRYVEMEGVRGLNLRGWFIGIKPASTEDPPQPSSPSSPTSSHSSESPPSPPPGPSESHENHLRLVCLNDDVDDDASGEDTEAQERELENRLLDDDRDESSDLKASLLITPEGSGYVLNDETSRLIVRRDGDFDLFSLSEKHCLRYTENYRESKTYNETLDSFTRCMNLLYGHQLQNSHVAGMVSRRFEAPALFHNGRPAERIWFCLLSKLVVRHRNLLVVYEFGPVSERLDRRAERWKLAESHYEKIKISHAPDFYIKWDFRVTCGWPPGTSLEEAEKWRRRGYDMVYP